jgi:hypothetical protein
VDPGVLADNFRLLSLAGVVMAGPIQKALEMHTASVGPVMYVALWVRVYLVEVQ